MYTTLITPRELNVLINSNAPLLILDTRHDLMNTDAGTQAYAQAHIPNAFFMHMDTDLSGEKTGRNGRHPLPDLNLFAEKLRHIGLSHSTQVVVYDEHNGMMAARAWWLVRHLGHANVAVLNGGLNAWRSAELPVTDALPSPHIGDFTAQASLNRTVSADDLMAHLNDGVYQIIDARAPERFSGAVEPIDPVGGHIPHARNHCFVSNLNADLTFKDADTLRTEWLATLADTPIEQVVNQCGSGVTACHNMLAQHIAGLEGAALYAGSWSEWCSDEKRPVEKSEG
ncbi:sulfurtransferase [Hydromonas duriensis]|uniref:Sulfurtransferase n=1 Tax=Hydromonas duriensis TaxID=1527608 RepID=A0A4R6Y9K4_9BURK|nr:sulfurtransferase [Hydromonas duriensis]TDR32141.1 thiosulfate/3-mercaptopyruvate sulfurtransferase [Hydromonas duriensis]